MNKLLVPVLLAIVIVGVIAILLTGHAPTLQRGFTDQKLAIL
jgi:hypothetical protein